MEVRAGIEPTFADLQLGNGYQSRDYLRVLLHRAKQQFMAEYSHVNASPRKNTTRPQHNKVA